MKTKIFTLFTALTLGAGTLFASNTVVDGIYYNFDDANLTASVTYCGRSYGDFTNEYKGDVVIPATVTYGGKTYSVTSIGEDAFRDCGGLTMVTIGNSVESIGEYAFSGCRGLTSVTIGNSVTSIGSGAFRGCDGLTSVTLPNSVTSIGYSAFSGCSGLTSIIVESGNTKYDSRNNCNAIIETATNTLIAGCQSTTIPNSVTSIGEYAFEDCRGLTSVTIPNSVTSIGDWAFCYCSGLTSVTLPSSVTSIGKSAFYKCSGLTSVVWNAKNSADFEYDNYAPFYDIASQITSFTFGDEVEHIPACLCYGMSNLTSVTIPNSVTSIGSNAFYGCSGLTTTNYTGNIAGWCGITFKSPDSNPTTYTHNLYINDVEVIDLVIPDGVANIKDYAFSDCSSLTSVTIGNSVTSIGDYAFFYCSGLTSVTIGNSVESIGAYAFQGCSGLTSVVWNAKNYADFSSSPFLNLRTQITSVTFGDEVEHIPAYLCYGMSNLNEVTIPNSVTSIGRLAFYDTAWLENQPDGVIYINQSLYTYKGEMPENTSIVVREGTTQICGGAFSGCTGLTSITIPNSVTSIDASVFSGCSGLTSVTIPNFVTSIGYRAFYNCSGLTSVTIPNSVTSIGDEAFRYCSGLTSITIPNSVTSIGEYAFRYCSGLTSITIPNSVDSIGEGAFSGCSGLTSVVWNAKKCSDFSYASYAPFYSIRSQITSVTFGDEVEHIPAYLCFKMNNLTSLTLPNSIKSIGDYAFFYCSGLAEVTIGNSITSIGNSAFQGCSALREITALSTVPPVCSRDVFDYEQDSTSAILRCPCESREAYQTADTWSRFTEIRPADVPDITLLTTKEQGSVQVEEIICTPQSVVISATPQIGYVFARWSDGNTENPRTVLLAHDTTLTAEFGLAYSGKCGDNLYWEYKQNKLQITGSGDMYDFTAETQPWKLLLDSIKSVVWTAKNCADFPSTSKAPFYNIASQITSFTFGDEVEHIPAYLCYSMNNLTSLTLSNAVKSIGNYAFRYCRGLTSVSMSTSVETIGNEAFSYCTALRDITNLPIVPPTCGNNAFYNVPKEARLWCPCESREAYQAANTWRRFTNISCINSETADVTKFSVTPFAHEVQFTWPAEAGAATYELVISKDGVVFCTLTFNASGQLMGIAFAPSANAAETMGTSGFQIMVTGLDAASHYTYTFDAKDADGGVIQHYAGEFTTDDYVGLEQIELAGLYTQAGRIVCEGEFRIYDLLGRDVTRLNGSLCGVYVVKSGNAAVKVVVK